MEQQIRFCTSADGVRIAYAVMGEGPPLLLVMAWGSSLELFWERHDVRAFMQGVAQERRLVVFDRRGVGASQREVPDMALEAHVLDVAAVADELQLETFDLWGDFDGAPVAVAYAAQYPQRVSRLLLSAPFCHGDEISAPEGARSFADLIRSNWGVARRALADIVYPRGPTEVQLWFSNLLRESMSPEVAARYMELSASLDVRPFLPQVQAPTLVVHARRERRVPATVARLVAALIANARFVSPDIAPFSLDIAEVVRQFLDEGRDQVTAVEPAPTGLVTILFTDMESSTALTQRLGDAKAQELVRSHNAIVREALKAHGGSEIKHTGDGIMASFPSASRALECAIAIQRAVEGAGSRVEGEGSREGLRVRIGLNAGEPVAEEEDLFGTAVQLAARICDHGEAGEILASNVVRELAAGKGFLFSDRGDVALRGFEDPVRLYEEALAGGGLTLSCPTSAPALRRRWSSRGRGCAPPRRWRPRRSASR